MFYSVLPSHICPFWCHLPPRSRQLSIRASFRKRRPRVTTSASTNSRSKTFVICIVAGEEQGGSRSCGWPNSIHYSRCLTQFAGFAQLAELEWDSDEEEQSKRRCHCDEHTQDRYMLCRHSEVAFIIKIAATNPQYRFAAVANASINTFSPQFNIFSYGSTLICYWSD